MQLFPRGKWGELLRELELEGIAPPRRTFYVWAKEATLAPTKPWTLAADETGRPDVVLRVLRAVHDASSGRIGQIGIDEATWIVRLVNAKPELLEAGDAVNATGVAPWLWAKRYLRASPSEYAAIDVELATL